MMFAIFFRISIAKQRQVSSVVKFKFPFQVQVICCWLACEGDRLAESGGVVATNGSYFGKKRCKVSELHLRWTDVIPCGEPRRISS